MEKSGTSLVIVSKNMGEQLLLSWMHVTLSVYGAGCDKRRIN